MKQGSGEYANALLQGLLARACGKLLFRHSEELFRRGIACPQRLKTIGSTIGNIPVQIQYVVLSETKFLFCLPSIAQAATLV